MRDLLFLSHRIPYPPDKGEKIRAWHMFQHLTRRFRVHLGCFVDDPDDAARVEELRPLCADLACIPINRRTQQLKALLRARPGRQRRPTRGDGAAANNLSARHALLTTSVTDASP